MEVRGFRVRLFIMRSRNLKLAIQWLFARFGFRLTRLKIRDTVPYDMEAGFGSIYERSKPYTQTKMDNMYDLYSAVRFVVESGVSGDFVECGVWKGGSSMVAAFTFLTMGESNRRLWLYDTYAGMTEPDERDIKTYDGVSASTFWGPSQQDKVNLWNYSPLEEVKSNLRRTNYPQDHITFVKGRVEDTIPSVVPDSISVLRLDTDLYESTYHELCHLFPLLSDGGVLIIDDYGTWEGAKQATDQYFAENNISMLFHRVDEGARIGLKLPRQPDDRKCTQTNAGSSHSPILRSKIR